MNEFWEKVIIAALSAIIASVIGLLINMAIQQRTREKVWEKVKKLLNDVLAFFDIPRRIVARRLNSKDFLEWQDNMLMKIYQKDHFTTLLGRSYPVCSLNIKKTYGYKKADSLCHDNNGYPFLNRTDINMEDIYDTEIMNKFVDKEEEILMKKELMGNGWGWNGYKWFTKRSMRDGNHIGYTLDKLDFEGKDISKIHLSLGDYKLNLLTSHIMTFEFFKAYEIFKTEAKEKYDDRVERKNYLNSIKPEDLWPQLPFRRYIHKVNGDVINNVLFNGKGRYSLLSVQCLVMLCSTSESENLEYKTFFGKRSNSTRKVSTKLGCYQFPPSGGFDLYDGKDIDSTIVRENCSLKWSLMREYLEEIFNDKKFAKVDRNNLEENTAMIATVAGDPRTTRIVNMLDETINDTRFKEGTKKAYFTTVGANVDLIDLRLSVNYLLVINDYQYYLDGIRGNREDDDTRNYKFAYNEEVTVENKMLRSCEAVEKDLAGKRNIVEDSVALYVQGKPAFRKYLNEVVKAKNCIAQICND